ncbi:hypothetical protein D9619_013639 [Psilocybe cf. subviscida]|uniref:Uncharacterized protein n=1 Tax=Psilocybe cf. subviscida TaxID=2480587 RepID=A0A8H5BRC5_9AGAR|nr:hypothetical protein D9619_013639 [Psilocybe cf. subviscida]
MLSGRRFSGYMRTSYIRDPSIPFPHMWSKAGHMYSAVKMDHDAEHCVAAQSQEADVGSGEWGKNERRNSRCEPHSILQDFEVGTAVLDIPSRRSDNGNWARLVRGLWDRARTGPIRMSDNPTSHLKKFSEQMLNLKATTAVGADYSSKMNESATGTPQGAGTRMRRSPKTKVPTLRTSKRGPILYSREAHITTLSTQRHRHLALHFSFPNPVDGSDSPRSTLHCRLTSVVAFVLVLTLRHCRSLNTRRPRSRVHRPTRPWCGSLTAAYPCAPELWRGAMDVPRPGIENVRQLMDTGTRTRNAMRCTVVGIVMQSPVAASVQGGMSILQLLTPARCSSALPLPSPLRILTPVFGPQLRMPAITLFSQFPLRGHGVYLRVTVSSRTRAQLCSGRALL